MPEEHCGNHEKNTTDLAWLKGCVAVIALFAMPVIGYYVGSIDKKMEKVEVKLDAISTKSTESNLLIVQRLAAIEAEIKGVDK